jgi:hypothetical protein
MNVFRDRPAASLYLSFLVLGIVTYFGGTHDISEVRLLYLGGCVGVAFFALRLGTAYHFEVLVVLFAFSPFLRRIVDYHCGFDPHGYMLSGPLLAALLPTPALPAAVMAGDGLLAGRVKPYLLALVCLGYAALLTVVSGSYVSAVTGLGKSASVLLYGLWLLADAEDPRKVMRQGARAFALVMPIVGLYGIMQFLDPSPADRYWMIATNMASVGLPEPEKVRVFSTLNSPASFGNFMVFGLVLIGFVRSRWELLICGTPAAIALLLSQSRTSWLALAGSIGYTALSANTKRRATALIVVVLVAGTFAVAATPLSGVISARLDSISKAPSSDASAMVRLGEIEYIFNHLDSYLIGSGMFWHEGTGWAFASQGTEASDGLIVQSIGMMGVVFGLLFVGSVIWAALRALSRVRYRSEVEFVIAGALVIGQLLTVPFVNPTGAEFGVFLWTVIAVATRTPARSASARKLAPAGAR